MDEIIAAYMAEIDVTLIDASLRLTPQQRCERFEQFMGLCFELRRAGEANATQRAETADLNVTPQPLGEGRGGPAEPSRADER